MTSFWRLIDMDLQYQLVYSNRKTLGITVERDCSVVVRAPIGMCAEKINKLLESKKRWLHEKTHHLQNRIIEDKKLSKELVSGESMPYFGRHYRLQVFNSDIEKIAFKQKFIIHKTNQTQADLLFKSWYIDRAEQKIPIRVAAHAKKLGLHFNGVKISDAKYQWGSCTSNNNLTFNWRLIKSPVFVIDYVIFHELAHLIEKNHSSLFWQIVKTTFPDYQKAKDWLKQNGAFL